MIIKIEMDYGDPRGVLGAKLEFDDAVLAIMPNWRDVVGEWVVNQAEEMLDRCEEAQVGS